MKNRTRALTVIFAVLLIGCAIGIAGYHFFERGSHARPAIFSTGRTSGHTARLADQLQLTKEQEKQLGAILDDSRRQIETGRKEWDSRLQEIRVRTNERIAAILNEQQKRQFLNIQSSAGSHGPTEGQGHGHGHE
jgi:Spy/CpxP family protein refolding chaperone